ncbi:hypothetical protein BROUX41_001320 [Berkeleyomyces rouxiae]|uniref:uncharacterized protein n=1 Tax=Berkeleyomyces rouxiae TaxID=2035830 RepID=UPI003B7FA0C1
MSSTLGAASDARKARLAQLRNLKRKLPTDEIAAPESERISSPAAPAPGTAPSELDVATLHLSGRNYDAATRGPKLGFENAPNEAVEGPTLEEKAADIAAAVKETEQQDSQDTAGIDLFKLQPKKPNWDLKRDLDKRLEKLNVRTDNAIARLVRERIAASQKAARGKVVSAGGDQEAAGMDGTELVEGLRVREQEMEEEERRERAELDA